MYCIQRISIISGLFIGTSIISFVEIFYHFCAKLLSKCAPVVNKDKRKDENQDQSTVKIEEEAT
jgi:hypothetical protein